MSSPSILHEPTCPSGGSTVMPACLSCRHSQQHRSLTCRTAAVPSTAPQPAPFPRTPKSPLFCRRTPAAPPHSWTVSLSVTPAPPFTNTVPKNDYAVLKTDTPLSLRPGGPPGAWEPPVKPAASAAFAGSSQCHPRVMTSCPTDGIIPQLLILVGNRDKCSRAGRSAGASTSRMPGSLSPGPGRKRRC